MRPLGITDVLTAARAVQMAPARLEEIFALAERADQDRRLGNGSLEDAARAFPLAPCVDFNDPAFCHAIIAVLTWCAGPPSTLAARAGDAFGRRRIQFEPFR